MCKLVFNSAILIGCLFSKVALAVTPNPQLRKVYTDLQANKTTFYNSNIQKSDFTEKFKNLDKELNAKYAQLKVLEGDQMTIESNQTAVDIELLEPLRILASNSINKKYCAEAKHENELNAAPDEKEQIQIIENIITKLCK